MPNIYWILGIFAFGLTVGWTSHTWYIGYTKEKQMEHLIDSRVESEKNSNKDAAKTIAKETEDEKKATASDALVAKHIAENADAFNCIVPDVGVRDLQQAIATHSSARKPH